ncbi:hypothetical protein C8J56DRAFT_1119023 [Mycena floridula]|nr:hypothetical protein C8J56DRAFT_1119023 [Mycena floridula]
MVKIVSSVAFIIVSFALTVPANPLAPTNCTPGAFSADVTALVFSGGLVETQVNRSLHNIADTQCRLDIVETELYNIGKAVDPFATAAQILRNDTLCADHADITKNFHNMISVCKTTEAVLDSLQVPACIARAFHPTDSDFSKSVKDTLCIELYESLSRSIAAYTAKLNGTQLAQSSHTRYQSFRTTKKRQYVRMHLVPQCKHPGEERNGEDNIAGGQKGKVPRIL